LFLLLIQSQGDLKKRQLLGDVVAKRLRITALDVGISVPRQWAKLFWNNNIPSSVSVVWIVKSWGWSSSQTDLITAKQSQDIACPQKLSILRKRNELCDGDDLEKHITKLRQLFAEPFANNVILLAKSRQAFRGKVD